MFCFGLCAAICARIADTSLLEWKALVTMLAASLLECCCSSHCKAENCSVNSSSGGVCSASHFAQP